MLAGTEQGSLNSTPLSKGRRASSEGGWVLCTAAFAPDVPYVSSWWSLVSALLYLRLKNTHKT